MSTSPGNQDAGDDSAEANLADQILQAESQLPPNHALEAEDPDLADRILDADSVDLAQGILDADNGEHVDRILDAVDRGDPGC